MEGPWNHPDVSPQPSKKRRIPKACAACRRSKMKCDENRPCSRCVQSGSECIFFERPKDPYEERFERIEVALSGISTRVEDLAAYPSPSQSSPQQPQVTTARLSSVSTVAASLHEVDNADFTVRPCSRLDVVATSIVSEADARFWYQTFFSGCDRFVPIFDSRRDSYEAVRSRSGMLFDIIVAYGCRAATGVLSRSYQTLYHLLRRHTSDLVLRMSDVSCPPFLEDVQALLVIASYSESGSVLCDVALRSAVRAGLPDRVHELIRLIVETRSEYSINSLTASQSLYQSVRVWYSLFNLDQILSLDGGKPPSIMMHSSSRRVRGLLSHPFRTPLDLRLLAQVELNALRAESNASIGRAAGRVAESLLLPTENALSRVVTGAALDLDIWLSDWQGLVGTDPQSSGERASLSLNLRIQHAWALLALHLRALTACGVENIALMTDSQRSVAFAAKEAAERHLQLLLTSVSDEQALRPSSSKKPYVANFRYAMEFVWAKNVFTVLIVLRLGILLGDLLSTLTQRLQQARDFLHELEKVGMGANISYTRILAQTVDKCEKAVKASMQARSERTSREESSESDFQSFVPKEFMFTWDFPGLNLCYIPLDWQDLFLDFGTTA